MGFERKKMRRKLVQALQRGAPHRARRVILGDEEFVDGSRHLYLDYGGGRRASVGRPRHGAGFLIVMIQAALRDAAKGLPLSAIRTRALAGRYDEGIRRLLDTTGAC